jgi:hypothetical protein
VTTSRLQGRRGDGSAVVNGWVAIYTLGLPAALRARRRGEIAAHLADESVDAVRRHEVTGLRRRRIARWLLGIPDDLTWRLTDARALAARYQRPDWVPLSRWSAVLLAIVAIGGAGAFVLVAIPFLGGTLPAGAWPGVGPAGFLMAVAVILAGVTIAVPWPRAGAGLVTAGSLIGLAVAPWLWGCWGMALIAGGLRWYQAATDA